MTRVPQVLVNVPVPNTELLDEADAVWSAVAEEERLGDSGRVLLRPSGTEPLVRVMVEAIGDGVAEEIAHRLGSWSSSSCRRPPPPTAEPPRPGPRPVQ